MINSKVNPFPKADFFSTLLFLFFIQQITFLVESIYMLNLLNTQMDIRAMGILLLGLPVLLFIIKHNKATYVFLTFLMLTCILISPLLASPLRIFSSGLGAGLFLLYFGLQLSDKNFPKVNWGKSAALATLISIVFRAGDSLDISISGHNKFIGWLLVLTAAIIVYFLFISYPEQSRPKSGSEEEMNVINPWLGILGLAGTFIFIYFAFSSPGVIARWTEGDYDVIQFVLAISILPLTINNPELLLSKKRPLLILAIWNGIFLIFFIWNILFHRVALPSLADITPVVVEQEDGSGNIICYLMLILSPVIFINISWFTRSIKSMRPSRLGSPFLGAVTLIILCVFILIFTNTWGYVGSVSRIFRNQFHIPFILAGFFMMLPIVIKASTYRHEAVSFKWNLSRVLTGIIALALFIFIVLKDEKIDSGPISDNKQLTLMTYNIQQGVDLFGNKNFEEQLARIKETSPDILCLQESDASRISGGNSDVVRYFSKKLGYYSYYGPKTTSGTYGTAILSRFPLQNTRTIFTYSSKDEIGTAIAEVSVGRRAITIINSHPAGNQKSREEHIDMVISVAQNSEHVIAMGDYNFRQESPYYQQVTKTLNDSWLSIYPDAIGPIDMNKLDLNFKDRKTSSGLLLGNGTIDMKSRIDHIFLSDGFKVIEAHYLPAPESETDHPLHWAVVKFVD